jgi:ABC-type branched-subunit amino acid transport system ATPase component
MRNPNKSEFIANFTISSELKLNQKNLGWPQTTTRKELTGYANFRRADNHTGFATDRQASREKIFSDFPRLHERSQNPSIKTSGDDRARTDNPRLAKAVLSQLSYVPESGTIPKTNCLQTPPCCV